MKLLFNETHEMNSVKAEFFWYNSQITQFEQLEDMIKDIPNYVNKNPEIQTQYYFYTDILNDDAIGDKVRTTILIRSTVDGDCALILILQILKWH